MSDARISRLDARVEEHTRSLLDLHARVEALNLSMRDGDRLLGQEQNVLFGQTNDLSGRLTQTATEVTAHGQRLDSAEHELANVRSARIFTK